MRPSVLFLFIDSAAQTRMRSPAMSFFAVDFSLQRVLFFIIYWLTGIFVVYLFKYTAVRHLPAPV